MATNPELDSKLVENQQAQPAPTVTLTVDVNELNVIMGGLQELPHRIVDPVLKKLFQQAQAQLGQPG
jgi:hypothetical protein